jgi:hypothetical protein
VTRVVLVMPGLVAAVSVAEWAGRTRAVDVDRYLAGDERPEWRIAFVGAGDELDQAVAGAIAAGGRVLVDLEVPRCSSCGGPLEGWAGEQHSPQCEVPAA